MVVGPAVRIDGELRIDEESEEGVVDERDDRLVAVHLEQLVGRHPVGDFAEAQHPLHVGSRLLEDECLAGGARLLLLPRAELATGQAFRVGVDRAFAGEEQQQAPPP